MVRPSTGEERHVFQEQVCIYPLFMQGVVLQNFEVCCYANKTLELKVFGM